MYLRCTVNSTEQLLGFRCWWCLCWCLTEVLRYVSPGGLPKPTTTLLQHQDEDCVGYVSSMCPVRQNETMKKNNRISCILADCPSPQPDVECDNNSRKQMVQRCFYNNVLGSTQQDEEHWIFWRYVVFFFVEFTRSTLDDSTYIPKYEPGFGEGARKLQITRSAV